MADLTGSIPPEIENFVDLEVFQTVSNKISFFGTIPTTLGNLRKLRRLGIIATGISGTIPTELGKLESLTEAYVARKKI
jgi:hypothetical protein